MQERDLRSRVLRVRISYALVANQYAYPVATVVSGGTVLHGPATPSVIDLLSVTVATQIGVAADRSLRYPLGRWPYSKVAWLLSKNYPTYPMKFSTYGGGSAATIMLAPMPALAYPAEWDFFCYSPALVNPGDPDPLPYPYTDPVPFFAAYFAKLQAQRLDEAKDWKQVAEERLKTALIGARPIAVADPFSDMQTRWR